MPSKQQQQSAMRKARYISSKEKIDLSARANTSTGINMQTATSTAKIGIYSSYFALLFSTSARSG